MRAEKWRYFLFFAGVVYFSREMMQMLADCHIHMVLDGVYWKSAIARHADGAQQALVRQTLARYQSLGTGYLRDGGDRWGVCELAAKLAPEYGVRYASPAFPICRAGHYGGFIGRTFETFADYRALIGEVRSRGGSFVKLMISGIMDFDRYGVITDEPMPRALLKDCIALAHDAGFAVMAHANGDAIVAAALSAGVDSIEHGAYLSTDTICQLAESGAVWTPTLVTIANLIGCGRYPDEVLQPLLEYQCEAVKLAAGQGAYLAPGSDAGAYRVFHGQGMLDEYALFETIFGADAAQILVRGAEKIMEKF